MHDVVQLAHHAACEAIPAPLVPQHQLQHAIVTVAPPEFHLCESGSVVSMREVVWLIRRR